MNKRDAYKIAKTIKNIDLQNMFWVARNRIKDWTKVSKVNKGMTIGAAWNILAKDFDPTKDYSILAKKNMIHEFGDYLPENLKPTKKKKKGPSSNIHHEEPVFKSMVDKLRDAIDSGEFDDYFEKEKRMVDRMDARVRSYLKDREITPELEERFLAWVKKYEDYRYYKHQELASPNLFDALMGIVAEEGQELELDDEDFLCFSHTWRGYVFKQYCGQGTFTRIYRGEKMIYQSS